MGGCEVIETWEYLGGVVVCSLQGEEAEVLRKGLRAWSEGGLSGKGVVQVLRGRGAALPLGLDG